MNRGLIFAIFITLFVVAVVLSGTFWGMDRFYYSDYTPKNCFITYAQPACSVFPCNYNDIEYIINNGDYNVEGTALGEAPIVDEIPLFVNHTYACRYRQKLCGYWYCKGTAIFEIQTAKL